MAKAAGGQPGMMVYMMVPAPYENNGQPPQQGWAMGDHSYGGNNFGNGQTMLVAPMQTDSRGNTFGGGQAMPGVAPMQPDASGNSWNGGNWQPMPDQSQQWPGGWDSQSGGMQQQSQQQDQQQPWTNPMAGNPSGMMPQGHQGLAMQAPGQQQQQQQQHQQPQQFNMQQQQQFQMQQQQQFFVPQQQFHQGNVQQQQQAQPQQQQVPQQQATQQQPQFSQQQITPNEQTPMTTQGSPTPTPASLAAKPKRKGLINKPIAKEMGPSPSEAEMPKEQLAPISMAPIPTAPTPTQQPLASAAPTPTPGTEQRARKGLVNKPIAKEGGVAPAPVPPVESPKEEPVGPPPAPAPAAATVEAKSTKRGLMNKPIVKDNAVETKTKEPVAEESPAPPPAPVQEKPHLAMKDIANWEPTRANESDNKSMIKALGLEPVNPARSKARPTTLEKRPTDDTINDLKKFSQAATTTTTEPKKGFRLKNAALTPGGTPKEPSVVRDSESSKPVEAPKVEEPKSAPSQVVESTPKASQENSVSSSKSVGAVLLGREGGFTRDKMLQFWKAVKDLPIKNLGYHTAPRDEDAMSPGEMWRNPRKNSMSDKNSSWRRDPKPVKGKGGMGVEELTNKSVNPYKKKTPVNRAEALTKQVRGLLNLICPENKEKIIKRFHAEVKVDNVEELEIVIDIIFHKVTDDPHHCETYVDMVRSLSHIYPEFPQEEGQAPIDFRRMLVNQCQNKFEDLLQSTDDVAEKSKEMEQEEYEELVIRQKKNALATMKFIGYLYLRKLIAAAVIRQVVKELLNGTVENAGLPPDLQVEYAIELIQTTGHDFDKTEKDKVHLNVFFGRLQDLKKVKKPDGKPCLQKRLQFAIQDLVDMRNGGWEKNKHKEEAKKLDDIRDDQDREEREAATAKGASRGHKGRGGRH